MRTFIAMFLSCLLIGATRSGMLPEEFTMFPSLIFLGIATALCALQDFSEFDKGGK